MFTVEAACQQQDTSLKLLIVSKYAKVAYSSMIFCDRKQLVTFNSISDTTNKAIFINEYIAINN